MKKLKVSLLILPFVCTSAFASNNITKNFQSYVGGGLGAINYQDDVGLDLDIAAFSSLAGVKFNQYFSAEARVGFGITDDSHGSALGYNFSVKNYYGAYAKAGYPVTNTITPYVIAGYTRGTIKHEIAHLSFSTSDSDFSYGIGAEYKLNKKSVASIEYMKYFSGDFYDVDGLMVSYSYNFK